MTEYTSGYQVLSSPLAPTGVRMERDELERFCHEKKLPLFHLLVGETVAMGIIQTCKPYMKFFTIYEGQWFTAVEYTKEENEVKT